jgi:hypothetical protein
MRYNINITLFHNYKIRKQILIRTAIFGVKGNQEKLIIYRRHHMNLQKIKTQTNN